MDGESSEEQAMEVVRQRWEVASPEERQAIVKEQEDYIFPYPSWLWQYTKWKTLNGITYVTPWGRKHLTNNIKTSHA